MYKLKMKSREDLTKVGMPEYGNLSDALAGEEGTVDGWGMNSDGYTYDVTFPVYGTGITMLPEKMFEKVPYSDEENPYTGVGEQPAS